MRLAPSASQSPAEVAHDAPGRPDDRLLHRDDAGRRARARPAVSGAEVVIVGGGAAGLSAAGALRHRGVDAVVLERDDRVGGSWARRYDRLRLHTARHLSGLAHYPIPRRYPRYLARDELVAYLQEYARALALRVETGRAVRAVRRAPDGTWRVDADGGERACRVVVVATGQYGVPVLPEWPGRERYAGTLVHSSGYASAAPYAGRRVLVVGAGNSGTEIAADLAEGGAALVALSVRTPPPIVPRDPFGSPVQQTSLLLSMLPAPLADRLARLTARLVLGDLTRHGWPGAAWAPYSASRVPVIDAGFVRALKRGAVQVRPALERLTESGAAFRGGREEPFDAVVAATGFRTGLESLLDADDARALLDAAGEPSGTAGEPTARPGIYFTGFTHSLRGHLFEANRASRRLARHVARYLGSPRGENGSHGFHGSGRIPRPPA